MEWEQYRMNLILKSEAKEREEGYKEGFKEGFEEEREKARKEGMIKEYKCLLRIGVEKELALKSVCDDYLQYPLNEIRRILGA